MVYFLECRYNVGLHGCAQEDEGVPLGDILHLTLQMERFLGRLPHVLKYGLATLSLEIRAIEFEAEI